MSFRVLLLKCCRDEEGVCLGVFMLSNLNADLWDSNTNLVQEPQQSVVIYCICKKYPFHHLKTNKFELIVKTSKAIHILNQQCLVRVHLNSSHVCRQACQRQELTSLLLHKEAEPNPSVSALTGGPSNSRMVVTVKGHSETQTDSNLMPVV